MNFLNHALGDYFKSYKDFFDLQTSSQFSLLSNLRGMRMYTSVCNSPFKKICLTSSWHDFRSKFAANEKLSQVYLALPHVQRSLSNQFHMFV